MRNRTHLGDEKRHRSQGCDAQFDATRPFEQGRPLTQEARNASTVDLNRKPSNRLAAGLPRGLTPRRCGIASHNRARGFRMEAALGCVFARQIEMGPADCRKT
jgi:hypothetical protein